LILGDRALGDEQLTDSRLDGAPRGGGLRSLGYDIWRVSGIGRAR
jgi:hypothetical protein